MGREKGVVYCPHLSIRGYFNMCTNMRNLPIGVQDFEKLREANCIYIDKTAYIYELTQSVTPYFLSRPRRFGKSLLLSTMKAYFLGKKKLFEGLAITELTKDDPDAFAEYPVFYFDFNGADYSRIRGKKEQLMQRTVDSDSEDPEVMQSVEEVIDFHLREWEKIYGFDPDNRSLADRFKYLLKTAAERTGRKAVVLVDEYDKPLLESDPALDEYNRAVFKGFFGTLKSYDAYLRFVFISGVTKFSKISIFSDLNQLQDISIDRRYACICGITDEEMIQSFMPEIDALAETEELTREHCITRLQTMYDGYHFFENSPGLYNPFSLLNTFSKLKFGAYWFESETPTFLVKVIKETGFDVKTITEGQIYIDEIRLSEYRTDDPSPVPLLYQSGYLTIKDYDKRFRSYRLGYPNDEVKYGFLRSLVPLLLNQAVRDTPADSPLAVQEFVLDIESGKTDSIRSRLTALFASLPYPEGDPGKFDSYVERDFQNVIYITFMLLGQYVKTQVHNAAGRADIILETDRYIYLFEFKRDKSAEEALKQIEEKGYGLPYAADPRILFKIGVNFDSHKRNISEWKIG